ncbi:Transcription factor dbaG [Paramyrothecium foliicola]|nr:Transcription factor dbaG [Paramyrothecium foliicola]
MVYCGKPSRGCQMCRTRRIKCDETKPTCKQCAKSQRKCPGYKDEFDLVFRNETQATERRAKKANRKALALKAEKASASPEQINYNLPSSATRSSASPSESQSVGVSIQLPLDQHASCHFVSNFVLVPRQGSPRGYMDFLPQLLKTEGSVKHFKYAFDACALASLNNRVGSGADFAADALGNYTKALAATHEALRSPELAQRDSTLAAVLLLGLFENMTARQLGTMSWGSHIEGAVQLVKARGRNQVKTKVGLQLFVAVRTQMIIQTITSGKPPAMGADWWVSDGSILDVHGATSQRLSLRMSELRAEINRMMATVSRTPDNIELMLDAIRKCQMLDQECVNWFKKLPDEYHPRTVTWEDYVPNGDYTKAEVYPGRVDVYQDLMVVSISNMTRCARLLLASLIVRCAAWVCSPVDYRTTPEYATAAKTCVDMITDIVASVPFQLGWFSSRQHLLERAGLSTFVCGKDDALKGLPGYLLTYPLTCIANQDYTTDSQRAWTKGRLLFIANQLGVRYANMLTELNYRIPSMLIRRDGLANSTYVNGGSLDKILSGKASMLKPAQLKAMQDMALPRSMPMDPQILAMLSQAGVKYGGDSSPQQTVLELRGSPTAKTL